MNVSRVPREKNANKCYCSFRKNILVVMGAKGFFAGYTSSKIQYRLKIQFVKLNFFKLIFKKSSRNIFGVKVELGSATCFQQ